MSSAGNWKIKVWQGGYPVWCEVLFGDKEVVRIHHRDLHDLKYAAERAIIEARTELPENYKHEMD